MAFRPCIDLKNGRVVQIVGGTLTDGDDAQTVTNYVSDRPAAEFAALYRQDGLRGGHVIMLGPGSEDAARSALAAYPGGLQIGGGITASNAQHWLDAGASHVIVTSYLFEDDALSPGRLQSQVANKAKEWLDGEGEKALGDWDISRDAPYFGIEIPEAAAEAVTAIITSPRIAGKRSRPPA